jgi:hypothetical protein
MQFNEKEDAMHAQAVRRIMETMARRNKFQMRSGRAFPVLMTMAVIAVLGTVLWYSYPQEKEYREINSVPLIRADAGPMKVVPNDPGGMDIPYRDSTVFDTLRRARAENADGQIENLLSDSETPISRDQMFAGVNTALEEDETQEIIENGAAEEPDVIERTDENTIAAVKVDKGNTVKTETATKTQTVASVAPTAPMPVKKPDDISHAANGMSRTEPAAGGAVVAATGGYLVQLASVRSQGDAQKMWQAMQKQFPNELGGLKLNVDVADLGTRGTYYRVQGGAVSESRARAICSVIDSKKSGGCFVVRNR